MHGNFLCKHSEDRVVIYHEDLGQDVLTIHGKALSEMLSDQGIQSLLTLAARSGYMLRDKNGTDIDNRNS